MNRINAKVQQLQQQKEALDARIAKLEELEHNTAPVKNLLAALLADYATEASDELPMIWEEILAIGQQYNLSVQPLATDELRQWETANAENEKLKAELEELKQKLEDSSASWPTKYPQLYNPQNLSSTTDSPCPACGLVHEPGQNSLCDDDVEKYLNPTPEVEEEAQVTGFLRVGNTFSSVPTPREAEYESDEAYDTVDSILQSTGFHHPEQFFTFWDANEKYESYRGWDVYFSVPNGGIVAIGLHCATQPESQAWDAGTEIIQELDSTFPESLADFDEIVAWTRQLIDRVENLKAPGQQVLPLEFSSTSESTEEVLTTGEEYDATDAVKTILRSHGFFMPDLKVSDCYDSRDKYEDYQEWAIYYTVTDKTGVTSTGELKNQVVDIGLDNPSAGFWTADADSIGDDDSTFPQNFTDHDAIIAWTRKIIDEVVAVTPTAAEVELTALQKLLLGNSNFTFEELDVTVTLESIIAPADDIVDFESEEVRITVTDVTGTTREYFESARTFLYQRHPDSVEQVALGYANYFLKDLKEEAKNKEKIARWNADKTLLQSNQQSSLSIEPESVKSETDTKFEVMGFAVQVYPQYSESNLVGATFRFMSLEEKDTQGKPKLVFSTSQLAAEIGDRSWIDVSEQLIVDYQTKEAERLEKLANPHAKEEDKFVKLVKITNCVGYLEQRDTGEILEGYATFSNKKPDGTKTEAQAKARAQKWADFLKESIQLECLPPRIPERMVTDNAKQPFAYEVKIVKPSIGQLVKLAEEDLSLLPLELEEKQARSELAHSELQRDIQNDNNETIETDKEFLTDNEIKIVELIRAALSKFDAEAVQEINSAEVPELVRTKVWDSLSEEEQKVYELLLKLEFAQAPDFSAQTPEFVTRVDGKQGKSVFLSLRVIDGETRRVWRYQGQIGNGGYPCKEAAAVAVWQQ
jgi:hypothetical protein